MTEHRVAEAHWVCGGGGGGSGFYSIMVFQGSYMQDHAKVSAATTP